MFSKIPPAGDESVNAGLMGKSREDPPMALLFPELGNMDLDEETGEAGA